MKEISMLGKNIEMILNFGFLGLAFLMLFLAFHLINNSNKEEDISTHKVDLIKKFMNIAIVFMILAGPLQWITMFVKSKMEQDKNKIALNIALANHPDWNNEFGQITIRKDGENHPITFESLRKEFKNNEEILLNISGIVSEMQEIRRVLVELQERSSQNDVIRNEG